jgi:hypothetical protein
VSPDVNEPRWQVVYPLGTTDAMRSLGTVAAPLLAGFGLATVGLLVTAERAPLLADWAVAAFAAGSTLMVFCVQLTCTGLLYATPPAERTSWLQGRPEARAALDVQRKDLWLSSSYFRRAAWAYDLALTAHLIGLTALLVPRRAEPGRWIGVAVVLVALVMEITWIVTAHRGRGPAWLLPGYRHARQGLDTPSGGES